METVIPIIIQVLGQYGNLIVFLGVMIGGEAILLPAVFLASIGVMDLFWVLFFGLAGIMLSDSVWYWVGTKLHGRSDYVDKIINRQRYQKQIDLLRRKFTKHSNRILIFSKFVYGTRIATILYSGYRKITYETFLKYNFIGSFLWLILITLLGYGIGLSWQRLAEYNDYIKYLALFGVLVLFMVRYIVQKTVIFLNYERN